MYIAHVVYILAFVLNVTNTIVPLGSSWKRQSPSQGESVWSGCGENWPESSRAHTLHCGLYRSWGR